MTKREDKGTTRVGYINRNGQKNLGHIDPPRAGTDHYQNVYILQCTKCEHVYGSNGFDIFQRKCPSCQGGRKGPKLRANEIKKNVHKSTHLANGIESETNKIVDLLKKEITYFKKLKSAIGDIHGHIHSLAVRTAHLYLADKHHEVHTWELSEKYGSGIDAVGKKTNGETLVVAEVKTTFRSEKKTLGRIQRENIQKDIKKLLATEATHKYLFIIDNKNRKEFERLLKNEGDDIELVNIFEC